MLYLDKNCTKSLPKNVCHQPIADVVLFEDHADPQLRGILRTLLINFIGAVLSEDESTFTEWVKENCCDDNTARFQLDYLVKIIIKVRGFA